MSDRHGRPGDEQAIVIRGYRVGDGDRLRALWIEVGFRLIGDDEDGLARFVARNPNSFLVAESGDEIVASAMGAWDGRRGWIYHVATAPSFRRLGLGSQLVERVEAVLRDQGCPRCLVIVERANEPALAFWRGLGYEQRETAHLGKAL